MAKEERRAYMNKYCVHDFETIEKRIKGYRELLVKSEIKEDKEFFGELYKDEKRWKRKSMDSHCTFCLGNVYHLTRQLSSF